IGYLELDAAVAACETLRAHSLKSGLACWTRAEHNSIELAAEYLCAVDAVHRSALDCRVSLKPLALAFRRDLLMKVVARARDLNVALHFDSPPAEVADVAYSAIREPAEGYPDVGCTIPGRWRRSTTDAEWAIVRGLPIRVVKGQWADPDDPETDTREAFLAV